MSDRRRTRSELGSCRRLDGYLGVGLEDDSGWWLARDHLGDDLVHLLASPILCHSGHQSPHVMTIAQLHLLQLGRSTRLYNIQNENYFIILKCINSPPLANI